MLYISIILTNIILELNKILNVKFVNVFFFICCKLIKPGQSFQKDGITRKAIKMNWGQKKMQTSSTRVTF